MDSATKLAISMTLQGAKSLYSYHEDDIGLFSMHDERGRRFSCSQWPHGEGNGRCQSSDQTQKALYRHLPQFCFALLIVTSVARIIPLLLPHLLRLRMNFWLVLVSFMGERAVLQQ